MFGQNTSTTTFGQPSAFNASTTPFGQIGNTGNQPSTSLFGQTSQPSSLFGSLSQPAASSSLFGTPQTQQTQSAFGGQATFGTSGSLFGNTTAQPQQQQQQTSIFGNTNRFSVGSTSTFGANTALGTTINVPNGTTIKYQPQSSTDTIVKNGHTQSTSINIRLQCITCMREYESKSLEELRMEDYAANRKGPQQQNLFGTSTMNSGTFSTGISNTGFGQTSTNSLFSNQKPFGSSIAPTTTATTSLFSTGLSSTGTSGGLFGHTSTNTFGQPTDNKSSLSFFNPSASTAPSTFSFGQPNTLAGQSTTSTSLFGNTGTNANPGSSLFQQQNSLTQNKPLFGSSLTFGTTQPQQQTTGNSLFSTGAQTGTGIFNQTSQQSTLFNTNQSSLNKSTFNFSQPSGLTGASTFNPSISTTNAFGANTNTGFGTSNTGGTLFGNNTFGSNSFGGFGASTSQPIQNTGSSFNFNLGGSSGFGNNTGTSSFNTGGLTSGGMFNTGLQNSNQFGGQQGLNGGSLPSYSGAAPSMVNTDQIITRLQTLPYGITSSSLLGMTSMTGQTKTKFTIDPKTLNQYKISAKQQAESVKVQRIPVTGKPTTMLFDGLDDESSENLKTAADVFQPRVNIKKLLLKKNSPETSSTNTSLTKTPTFIKSGISIGDSSTKTANSSSFNNNKENESILQNSSGVGSLTFTKDNKNNSLDNTINLINKNSNNSNEADKNLNNEDNNLNSSESNTSLSSQEKSFTIGPLNFSSASLGGDNADISRSSNIVSNFVPPKCGVILTRPDYYTIPSLEVCDQYYNADDDTCIVDSFTVGRFDYGSIYWKGPLNIKGINLDEVVHIRRKEVIVYPDDDLKPTQFEGLNRPAQITLDQVWPIDKTTREFIKDVERLRKMKYTERLEKATLKLDAFFKEYRPETGSWVFVVKHFSKYGLDADDEDADIVENQDKEPKKLSQEQTQVKLTYDIYNNLQQKNNLSPLNDVVHLNGTDYSSSKVLNGSEKHHDFHEVADELMLNQKFAFNFKFNGSQQTNEFKFSGNNVLYDNQVSFVKSSPLKEDDCSLMRSALFVDDLESETTFKKCKNLSFSSGPKLSMPIGLSSASQNGSLVGSQQQHQSVAALFPNKSKSSMPKKRRLVFEQSRSKPRTDAYFLRNTQFPKARFINGSNKFLFFVGDKVLIFDIDLVRLWDNQRQQSNASVEKLEKHLNEYSTVVDQNDSVKMAPLIKTNSYSLNPKIDQQMNLLIEALYGELSETGFYARNQERVRRILNWLFQYNKTLPVPDNSYSRIVHFLTTNELEFAVTECVNCRMPRLSYLVACGPYGKKELLVAQLDLWKRISCDVFIDPDLLKIYVILAGLSSWNLSNHKIIKPLDELEWTQQMVLLILYKTRVDEMLGTKLVKAAIEELTIVPNVVEYHLLAQHKPWVAITSSKNLLDAWFLQESLLSYNVINSEDFIMNRCDSINLFMASQIRDLRWSLFFSLHIQNDHLRCSATKELLTRNAAQLMSDNGGEELCQFLQEKYHLNEQWLNEAKSIWSKTIESRRMVNKNLLEIENNVGDKNKNQESLLEQTNNRNQEYKEILELVLAKFHSHRHQMLLPVGKKFQFLNNNKHQSYNKRIESK